MNGIHRSLILVLLLWAAGLCAAGQFAKIAVPFTDFRALYPDAGGTIGWLLSLISFVGAVGGLAAGALVSLLGLRRMLFGGLILGALLSFIQASLPGFGLFAASRVLEGAAHLAIVIAAPSLIANVSSDRFRGIAMALWSTFFGVAFALVAWIGLPQVKLFGVPPLFIVHGALTLLVAALLAVFLKNTDAPEAEAEAVRPGTVWQGLLTAIRSPRIAAPGVGWLFYTLTFVALLAVLPDLLPPGERDAILGLLPLLGIVVSLTLVPGLMKVMGASTLNWVGFGLSLCAVLFAGIAPLPLVCIALFSVIGLVQGSGYASVPELNSGVKERALSFGLVAQTGNIGNLTGTPILLFVLDRSGEADLFHFLAVLYGMAVAALLLLLYLRKRPQTRPA